MDISSATAQVAPDLLQPLATLSDTTGNQKKGHISLSDQEAYYLEVFQIYLCRENLPLLRTLLAICQKSLVKTLLFY